MFTDHDGSEQQRAAHGRLLHSRAFYYLWKHATIFHASPSRCHLTDSHSLPSHCAGRRRRTPTNIYRVTSPHSPVGRRSHGEPPGPGFVINHALSNGLGVSECILRVARIKHGAEIQSSFVGEAIRGGPSIFKLRPLGGHGTRRLVTRLNYGCSSS